MKIKKKNLCLPILFYFMNISSVNSMIFSHIDKSEGTPTNAKYYFTIDSFDNQDTTQNPCFGDTVCTVGINHRHSSKGEGGNAVFAEWTGRKGASTSCVINVSTIGKLLNCLKNTDSNKGHVRLNVPLSGVTNHTGPAVTQECVGLFWKKGSSSAGGQLLPGSVCGIAPPPIGACSTPDSVVIDHKTLSESEVNLNNASATFIIDCNKKVAAKLYFKNLTGGKLNLGDGSIYSTLSIDNQPVNDNGFNKDLSTGSNYINLSSSLHTNGKVKPGSYNGQAVMIISLQ
ncbi:MrpH family fimbial adhesin [Klebsiella aerogenes]|uniref:MrpH family fimbial adhesin n=1 Tax=Klebsiella aerogenes TaxID=548 RepID=UPI000B22EEAC|nr:hypothetical protein [Klebsiella aerogenes]